jgi:hypothetical protein
MAVLNKKSHRFYGGAAVCSVLLMLSQRSPAHDIAQYLREANDIYQRQQELVSRSGLSAKEQNVLRGAVSASYIWTKRHLIICFGPKSAFMSRTALLPGIAEVAREWVAGTELILDFNDPVFLSCEDTRGADIRIFIDPTYPNPDYVSELGNASENTSLQEHPGYSMSLTFQERPELGNVFKNSGRFRFYVLHEFGHALGFVHEHQRRNCNFDVTYLTHLHTPPYAEPFVSQWMGYLKEYDLSAYPMINGIGRNSSAIGTGYDPASVMQYNETDPNSYVGGKSNTCYRSDFISKLSERDLQVVQYVYGRSSPIWRGGGAAPSTPLSPKAFAVLRQATALRHSR